MHTFTLTTAQARLILAALATVSPCGGGSPTFTLHRELTALTGLVTRDDDVAVLARNVITDAIEAGCVTGPYTGA